jgi:hypothetical protein
MFQAFVGRRFWSRERKWLVGWESVKQEKGAARRRQETRGEQRIAEQSRAEQRDDP